VGIQQWQCHKQLAGLFVHSTIGAVVHVRPRFCRVLHTALEIILYLHMAHTAQDHVSEKDRGKFLKYTQRAEIAHAVKIAPLQNSLEYLLHDQDSPTKSIEYKNSNTRIQLLGSRDSSVSRSLQ
jgi:ferritin